MSDGTVWLESILTKRDASDREMIKGLFSHMGINAKETILDAITYGNKAATQIYKAIEAEVEKESDPAKIKQTILTNVIKNKDENKYWFSAFWNIIKFQDKLERKVADKGMGYELDKSFLEVIDAILGYWKQTKPEIYYNIPITSVREGTALVGKMVDPNILDNLYTNLSPEGPQLLLNLKGVVKVGVESAKEKNAFLSDPANISETELKAVAKDLGISISNTDSNVTIRLKISNSNNSIDDIKVSIIKIRNTENPDLAEILKLKFELANIKHLRKSILSSDSTDSTESLKTKIRKATLIKQILVAKKSKSAEDLINKTIADLEALLLPNDPVSMYKAKLSAISRDKNPDVFPLASRLITMLDGHANEDDTTISQDIINQTLAVLNSLYAHTDFGPDPLVGIVQKMQYEQSELNLPGLISEVIVADLDNKELENLEAITNC